MRQYSVTSRVRKVSIGFMLLTFGVGASLSAPKKHQDSLNVGMIALLAAPQKYNGKIIRTTGFLHLGRIREDDSLWLHEEDGKLFLYQNSFALDLSEDQRRLFLHLNHTYVLITGTLHSQKPESTRMNTGTIVNVTQLDGWQPYQQ